MTAGRRPPGEKRGTPRAGAHPARHPPSLPCSQPATKRRAETAYAASDFFAGVESFAEDDDVEDSVFDSFFSPSDRSFSRLRRLVP